jgi:hypothetical protein
MAFIQTHLFTLAALVAVGLALVVAGAAGFRARPQSIHSDADWPVDAMPFLTAREREWHRALVNAFPHFHVFAQVALSQLVDVRKSARASVALRNRFRQLVADVVLCDSSYDVLAVIEIDDASHGRAVRREADNRKAKALGSAGIKLVRIPKGVNPSSEAIRKYVALMPEASNELSPRHRAGAL